MAMTFGKGNRSIAFNPTAAFPLDVRSYFESYDDALAAAQSAAMAGSTETVYYFGQTVAVVENNVASLYIIQPDKTLAPFAIDNNDSIKINANQFDFDINGKLILKGSNTAKENSFVSIDADGHLVWVDPIETYTKTEIDSLIANAAHLQRKIVESVDAIKAYMQENDDAHQYIFMVPTGFEEEADKYDEYMVITIADEQVVEKLGSWEVDLSDYTKQSDLEAILKGYASLTDLSNKIDKKEGYDLISNDLLSKLEALNSDGEKNYINDVSSIFLVNENRQLNLNDLSDNNFITKALNGQMKNHRLINPTEIELLSKLVLDSDGTVGISGKVNVDSVVGLSDWLNNWADENTSLIKGLSEENFTTELKEKLENGLYITSVNEEQLKVENNQLNIIKVDMSKVDGLQEALNQKASMDAITEVSNNINSLANELNTKFNNYVLQSTYDEDIAELWDALTWKDIPAI